MQTPGSPLDLLKQKPRVGSEMCGFFFLKILFIYSWETQREGERYRQREREKQAPCREPDAELDPRSPWSHPRLQVAPNRCATGAALYHYFQVNYSFIYFLKILFIHKRHRERQREKQAPCRNPDAGLNPRTLESWPDQRQILNHWATQVPLYFCIIIEYVCRSI